MPHPVLQQLSTIVAATAALPVAKGLGAVPELSEQVQAIAAAKAVLQRELAVRMAAMERQDPRSDPRGLAVAAGIGSTQAALLRSLGRFAGQHPALLDLWTSDTITTDQVRAVRDGSGKLTAPLREQLVDLVAPELARLDIRATRQLVGAVADQLQPGDPDLQEQSEQQARHLVWTDTPRGGIAFQGYLPQPQADQLRAVITARAEQLRAQGDGLSQGQRHADALSALLAEAGTADRKGGGLPAVLTLTVSLTDAERIADRNPNQHGTRYEARPKGDGRINGTPAGDAAIRFGLCCASITPILHTGRNPQAPPGDAPGGGPSRRSLLGRIARTTIEPLAIGRAVRLATGHQRRALKARDGGCVIPGCDVKAGYTEPHHVIGWALGGPTDLDNMVSLCFVHHLQVETGRYTFIKKQPGQPKPDGAHEHHHWWIIPPRR